MRKIFLVVILIAGFMGFHAVRQAIAQLDEVHMGDFTVDGELGTLKSLFMKETSAPSASTNTGKWYVASDNSIHYLSEAGTDTQVIADSGMVVIAIQSVDDVHDTTPTDAQLDAAFGTPATLGRGFIGTVDDADGDTNFYLAITSDASWYWVKMTKAL